MILLKTLENEDSYRDLEFIMNITKGVSEVVMFNIYTALVHGLTELLRHVAACKWENCSQGYS